MTRAHRPYEPHLYVQLLNIFKYYSIITYYPAGYYWVLRGVVEAAVQLLWACSHSTSTLL